MRANMVAIVDAPDGKTDGADWETVGHDFIQFHDGRRIERSEDTLLFVDAADQQRVKRSLRPGDAEWLYVEILRRNLYEMANARAAVLSLLDERPQD